MRLVIFEVFPDGAPPGLAPGAASRSPAPPVPLPVGIVRWHAPMPRLTLILKATFSFATDDGAMVLADEQEPLSLGQPLEGGAPGPDELLYPSDLVPLKRAADVLLAGSAHAATPTQRIDPAIWVGEWSHAFTAVAGAPTTAIPLRTPYLRTADGYTAIDVGARRAGAGIDIHTLDADFDYTRFNAAPPRQQLPAIPADAPIALSSLSPRAPTRRLLLPGLRPIVYVERDGDRVTRLDPEIDTLFLDTDRERCVVVFRENFEISSARSPDVSRILVAFAARGVAHEEILPLLPRATPGLGAEPPLLRAAAVDDDEEDVLRMARYETWEHAPEPLLGADEYARISAELGEKREPRADTLRRHGFDEDAWTLEERAWMGKLAAGAFTEDERVALDLGERMLAAQDALAAPHEAARTLEEYAELSVILEDCEDPTKVLAGRGLTTAEFMRLDRRFSRAMEDDEALAARFDDLVAAARREAPPADGGGSM